MLDLPWEDNSLAPKWNNKQKNVVSLNNLLKKFTYNLIYSSQTNILLFVVSFAFLISFVPSVRALILLVPALWSHYQREEKRTEKISGQTSLHETAV